MTPQDVLTFWFSETSPRQWFAKDEAFDAKIRERFEETFYKALRGELREWRQTPQGRLAEILVLDQLPRNMFRNSPEAFSGDVLALSLAQEAVAQGIDKKLTPTERHFFYMPYMHSESREAHRKAFWLFLRLVPYGKWQAFRYEWQHKRIIDRFGRYPHRNEILGRLSTPEEIAFLKAHSGF